MRLLATANDVHVWRSPDARAVDAALSGAGVELLRLPWQHCKLLADGQHFTRVGFQRFVGYLVHRIARALAPSPPLRQVIVLTDSTVDHWNWSDGGEHTGWASALLRARLEKRLGCAAAVDASCGSGFVASVPFGVRLRALAPPHDSVVVFVGGWNDAPAPTSTITAAIRGVAHAADGRRSTRHRP